MSSRWWRLGFIGGGLVVLCALPLYIDAFWLQTGLFAMTAVIGAIGLNLLLGITGQLSLAHAFFLAVGAYGYVFFAGTSQRVGAADVSGLGLPPVLAMVCAVVLAGVAGGLFSPIAGRLRGIYLGVASLALVFLGQHLLFNVEHVTGGFNGRAVPPFEILGFSFTNSDPDLWVLGVPYGWLERLWYLGLILVVIAYLFARNLVRGRPGRGLIAIRDSEVAAGAMGVNVTRYRAAAFVISSMYAGLAGAVLALSFRRVVPDYFSLMLSIDYLAMVVIGGLGSIGGAAIGGIFVSMLPQLLTRYANALPFIAQPGQPGVTPGEAARYLYGAAIVAVLIARPGGLATLARPLRGGQHGGRTPDGRPSPDRLSSGRPSSGRPSSGRPSSDRPSSGRPSSDRPDRPDTPAGQPTADAVVKENPT